MNPQDILRYVDSLHREKNIDKELVFVAIESAFQTAAKRQFGEEADVKVQLDRENGKILAELDGEPLADLIGLGGAAAIEEAAGKAGVRVKVPFEPGRVDATQADTDVDSFAHLEPKADGFRNHYRKGEGVFSPTAMMVDKADQLALSVPEMTVLVGGMRVLGANSGGSKHGVFTRRPGVLTNDFFVNLLDMRTEWKKSRRGDHLYEGRDRRTGRRKWTATPVDLMFGSSSELRAIAEVYAFDQSREKFVRDFVSAWTKVMRLDRFDLRR